MAATTHSSTFLLPSIPADNGHPRTYALVLLNQRLPRFTPLLWKYEQHIFVFAPTVEPIASTTNSPSFCLTRTPLMFETGSFLVLLFRTLNWILPGKLASRYKPDVIKGDMDSIRPEVLHFYTNMGTKVVDESHDQDTTDLHKCVAFICDDTQDQDKSNLCILAAGALGGRFDHEIGNINVLCRFSSTRIILLSDDCLIQLLQGSLRHEIYIQSSVEGPHCGLIPIGRPSRSTTTTGLQWDLTDTEMRFGGLISTSNIVKAEKITVQSDSDLLWTISIKKP